MSLAQLPGICPAGQGGIKFKRFALHPQKENPDVILVLIPLICFNMCYEIMHHDTSSSDSPTDTISILIPILRVKFGLPRKWVCLLHRNRGHAWKTDPTSHTPRHWRDKFKPSFFPVICWFFIPRKAGAYQLFISCAYRLVAFLSIALNDKY